MRCAMCDVRRDVPSFNVRRCVHGAVTWLHTEGEKASTKRLGTLTDLGAGRGGVVGRGGGQGWCGGQGWRRRGERARASAV